MMASSILLGLCMSAPVMYLTAIFIDDDVPGLTRTLRVMEMETAFTSVMLGSVAVACLLVAWPNLNWPTRLLTVYGVVVVAYSCLAFAMMTTDCAGVGILR